jgi:hypothetical protein
MFYFEYVSLSAITFLIVEFSKSTNSDPGAKSKAGAETALGPVLVAA